VNQVLFRRIALTFVLILIPFVLGLLITYEVIHVDWISFMENQDTIRPMEQPFPVPENSVPIQGAAYVGGIGSPENPIKSDDASVERGRILFDFNCRLCHGNEGKGDGPVAAFFKTVPPVNLTDSDRAAMNDGDIFLTITNGTEYMPALLENLDVYNRWDVVNYVRQLQANAQK
jgi:mono/diheme cytochrome c family protein